MLKPSAALKQSWKEDCRYECAAYWSVSRVTAFGRYKYCYQQCYEKKKKYEMFKVNGLPKKSEDSSKESI